MTSPLSDALHFALNAFAGAVSDAQLFALRREARMAQDRAMAALCDRALAGDIEARDTCARAIRSAADAQDTLVTR